MTNAVKQDENGAAGVARRTIYIDAEVLVKGEKRAKDDHRSFSNYVVQLIRKDVGDVKGEAQPA